MYRLLRALLFLLPPELAHRLGMTALKVLGPRRRIRRRVLGTVDLSVTVAGLHFPNPVGLAAGLDKDATAVEGLFSLGFGFVEVGTVTPLPQPGNLRPRLFRLEAEQALINRMGFNNGGAQAMAERLKRLRWRPGPVGVNLGRARQTPNARAAEDYRSSAEVLAPWADYLVVNASSPNTPGLRDLQEPQALRQILSEVKATTDKPLFLKIAPDLSEAGIRGAVDAALAAGAAGLIATNTTLERPFTHPRAKEPGGLSGAPLRDRSTAVVRVAAAHAAGRLPIIGVGGVFTAQHALDKLQAGASLVQLYTGFIYEGPGTVHRILRGLAQPRF